jgi:predicted anti-sigma-YlaC factor YlaD
MSRDPVHAEATLRLADYARRRLDDAGQAEVAAHLTGCSECRGMLEAYALMEAAGPAEAHLTGAAIAALAVSRSASPPAADEARHLDACRECADDLRLARAANDSAVGAGSASVGIPRSAFESAAVVRPASVTRWLLPLAAAFVIAVLGLATVRAWRQSGSLSTRIATLENDNEALQSQVADLNRAVAENRAAADTLAGAGTRDADGPVSYLFLRGTVRGAAAVDRLTLRPAQNSVYLALALDLPAAVRRKGEGGRVSILTAHGRECWSAAIPGEELDGLVARGDSLLLRIPAEAMEPGRQEIRLTSAEPAAGARTWFRSEFELSGRDRSR